MCKIIRIIFFIKTKWICFSHSLKVIGFIFLLLTACESSKSNELTLLISEIPQEPRWYFLILGNAEQAKSGINNTFPEFNHEYFVVIDTSKVGMPDKIHVKGKSGPLQDEIKYVYSGTGNYDGVKYRIISLLIAPASLEINTENREVMAPLEFMESKNLNILILKNF